MALAICSCPEETVLHGVGCMKCVVSVMGNGYTFI